MTRAFVDTSVWYAAAAAGDRNNHRAKELLRAHDRRVTSDHVVLETWRLLAHRIGWNAAERWWGGLRRGVAVIQAVTEVDLERAWAIGEAFADQQFALTDRTSFAQMERIGLRDVLTFDDDYAVYRFGRGRRQAFTIVR